VLSLSLPSFGLIATEKGFNIFVAGNGGVTPKHSELLAQDVPPADVIPILDRYLMFYIRTADKLQRTARWLENLPGGLKYLREVILEDKLGLCASLEAQMQELVDSYFDEWAEAVNNPAIAKKFKQFANTDEGLENMETEIDRSQTRPVYWAKDAAKDDFKGLAKKWSELTWQPIIEASFFEGADETPNGISANIKRGDTQLAVWNIRGRYYATQQMCPHKRAFVLSDGLVGEDLGGTAPPTPPSSNCSDAGKSDSACSANGDASRPAPWVSCPYHKRNFDLAKGDCKNDKELSIATFEAEERADGMVYIKLPPVEELDAALGTTKWMVRKGEGAEPFEDLDKKIDFKGQRAKKPGIKSTVGITSHAKAVQAAVGGSALDW
jgi:nitrite reductase (NAD(P)H)